MTRRSAPSPTSARCNSARYTVLVPDLAGWRRERMQEVPNVAYFELPPDWICEVLSPATAKLDRVQKPAIYAQFEVPWAWLIDPIARTLEVFGLDRGHWRLEASHADDARAAAPPFEAVELELDALWLRPTADGSENAPS
ncbi:MAG: Uma2 family endonuclease [Pseudomonadota bacterium]